MLFGFYILKHQRNVRFASENPNAIVCCKTPKKTWILQWKIHPFWILVGKTQKTMRFAIEVPSTDNLVFSW